MKKKYGGLRVDQAKRLKGLEQENARSYPSTERDVIRFPLSHSLSQQCPIRLAEMGSSVTLSCSERRRDLGKFKHFYQKFIPEMKAIAGEPLATQLLEKHLYSHPAHRWYKEGMTKEQLQKIQEFYRQRYGEAEK